MEPETSSATSHSSADELASLQEQPSPSPSTVAYAAPTSPRQQQHPPPPSTPAPQPTATATATTATAPLPSSSLSSSTGGAGWTTTSRPLTVRLGTRIMGTRATSTIASNSNSTLLGSAPQLDDQSYGTLQIGGGRDRKPSADYSALSTSPSSGVPSSNLRPPSPSMAPASAPSMQVLRPELNTIRMEYAFTDAIRFECRYQFLEQQHNKLISSREKSLAAKDSVAAKHQDLSAKLLDLTQQLHTSQATHQRLTTELWSNVNSCLGQIDHCSHLLQDNDLLQMRELYSKQAASKGVFEFSSLPSETNRATHAAAPSTGGGGGSGQTLRSMTVPVEPFHACGRASQPLNVHATTNAPATASTLAIDSPDSMIQILTTANISRKLEVRWQRDASLRISAIWQSTIADTTAVTQELDSITELLQEVGTRVEKVASAIEKHNQTLQSKHSTLTQLSESLEQFQGVLEHNVQAQGYAGFRDSNTDLMLHRIEAATDKLIPTTPEDEEKLSGGPADFSMEDSPTCKFTKTDSKKQVKEADVDSLISLLSNEKYPDLDFQKTFLLTYRSFMSTRELLQKLILRYCLTPGPSCPMDIETAKSRWQIPVRLRVLNFIRSWVEGYYELDFVDTEVQQMLLDFLNNIVANTGNRNFALQIHKVIKRQKNKVDKSPSATMLSYSSELPEPILPPFMSTPLKFSLLDSLELARQITLIESELFRSLQPREFLNLAWTKPDKQKRAPNIWALTTQFNRMSRFVVAQIVSTPDLTRRISALRTFIVIAMHLREMNNFHGVLEITSGLANAAVHRLKKTWAGIGAEGVEVYHSLAGMFEQTGWATYREELRAATAPVLPYIGVYLTDIAFLHEDSSASAGDLVNFARLRKVADVILAIKQFQNSIYCFRTVPAIRDFLLNAPDMSNEAAYQLSKEIEPSEIST